MPTLAYYRKATYPFPVYVAEFADGTSLRMSFYTPKGKPIDANRGRRLIQAIVGWCKGSERFTRHQVNAYGPPDYPLHRLLRQAIVRAPYTPIERNRLTGKRLVRGYVEHAAAGIPVRFLDPHFAPLGVTETAKPNRQTAQQVKSILADLVAYLDGEGPDDALQRARDLIAA